MMKEVIILESDGLMTKCAEAMITDYLVTIEIMSYYVSNFLTDHRSFRPVPVIVS